MDLIPASRFIATKHFDIHTDSEYHVLKAKMECQKTFYSNVKAVWQNKQKKLGSDSITQTAKRAWNQPAKKNFLEEMLKANFECDRQMFKHV